MSRTSDDNQRATLGRVIGVNIRRLRGEAGLNQRDFIDHLQSNGMASWSQARVSNAETANQPLNTVFELVSLQRIFSDLLNRHVSLDEFVR